MSRAHNWSTWTGAGTVNEYCIRCGLERHRPANSKLDGRKTSVWSYLINGRWKLQRRPPRCNHDVFYDAGRVITGQDMADTRPDFTIHNP